MDLVPWHKSVQITVRNFAAKMLGTTSRQLGKMGKRLRCRRTPAQPENWSTDVVLLPTLVSFWMFLAPESSRYSPLVRPQERKLPFGLRPKNFLSDAYKLNSIAFSRFGHQEWVKDFEVYVKPTKTTTNLGGVGKWILDSLFKNLFLPLFAF